MVDSLADKLVDKALLEGDFTLRSGEKSRYYFDKFLVTTSPDLLRQVASGLASILQKQQLDISLIAAPELGAVPLATALSLETGIPFVIVRSKSKGYGTAKRIEGRSDIVGNTLLVEDVVTSGGAALDALEALKAAGLSVVATLCLLDRQSGGSEALEQAGAPLTPLLTWKALIGQKAKESNKST